MAAIEFALWSLLVFAALLPCLDFATYLIVEGRLGSAVQQASVLAYNMRNSDSINTAQLIGYVPSAASLPGSAVTTTIVCNGGAQSCAVPVASRQCTCVNGLTSTYTAASTCGTPCPNGATSGYYLTIRASYPYHAMVVPDRWLDGSNGASAVEFALVAPVLLAFIFLLIEGGRMQWTQQALQEVASNTARCMALGTTACADTPSIQAYARERGAAWGIPFSAATITVAANQTCSTVTGMNKITISLPYGSATKLLPLAPSSLNASACFPSVS